MELLTCLESKYCLTMRSTPSDRDHHPHFGSLLIFFHCVDILFESASWNSSVLRFRILECLTIANL